MAIYLNSPAEVRRLSKHIVRRPTARLLIEWSGTHIDPALNAFSDDANRVSYPLQTIDGAANNTHKWFCVDDYSKLDCTFCAMPDNGNDPAYQVGWRGNIVCDSNGEYSQGNRPILGIRFTPRYVTTLTVVGDNAIGEYPLEFFVSFFINDVWQHDVFIHGNNSEATLNQAACRWDINFAEEHANIDMITIVVVKWNVPNTFVKIIEAYSNIEATISAKDILSLSVLEETESSGGTLPVGNISCNEIDITLQNLDNRYFPFNEASDVHTHITRNRKIVPYVGFIDENGDEHLVPKGLYWSGEWNVSEQDSGASVSAQDRMAQLQEYEYNGFSEGDIHINADGYGDAERTYWLDITPRDLIAQILENFKHTKMIDLEFDIDPALADRTIPVAFFASQSYFDLIKSIAQVSMAYAFMDTPTDEEVLAAEGGGNVGLRDILRVVSVEGALTHSTASTGRAITARDYLTRTQPENSAELANEITVLYHNYEIVDGKPEEVEGFPVSITRADSDSQERLGIARYEYPDNNLIQSENATNEIAYSLLNIFGSTHQVQTLQTFGDPTLSILDRAVIPEFQKFCPRENSVEVLRAGIYTVKKIQTEYDGSLRQSIECRRFGDAELSDIPTIISFFYAPVPVFSDDETLTLFWETENADTVEIVGFATGLDANSDLVIQIDQIENFATGYVFTLIARNAAGEAQATVAITVGDLAPLLGSINTSPTTVYSTTGSGSVTVRWNTLDVQMVELNGVEVSLQGEQVFVISQDTVFTLYGYSGWNGATYTARGRLSATVIFVPQPLPNWVMSNVIGETEKYITAAILTVLTGSIGQRRPPPIIPVPPAGVTAETGTITAVIYADGNGVLLTGSIGQRRPPPIIPVPPAGVTVEDGVFTTEGICGDANGVLLVGSIGDRRAGHQITNVISEAGFISAFIDPVLTGSIGPRYS